MSKIQYVQYEFLTLCLLHVQDTSNSLTEQILQV